MTDTLLRRFWLQDPRHYQILVLASLLIYGVTSLDFEVAPRNAVILLGGVLAVQALCTRLWRLPAFDARSALISGLSLCLLLRTASPLLAITAAALAIASKFTLRIGGKHVFNPTNFALVVLLLASDGAWVSPGQWGNAAFFGFLMACLGGMVVYRAARSDVTFAFLAFYVAVVFGRALWLGQPPAIPLHMLHNGALLLFAFFMISDPKTTPDSRAGRLLFAALVALGAGFVAFVLYRPNGLLLSLAFLSPLVPLLDRLLPGPRYSWARAGRPALASPAATPVNVPSIELPLEERPAMRRSLPILPILAALLGLLPGPALAFCGFYVAKADTKLFNQASRVALVRDGDRTVLTMANDFRGEPREFALVVPVPTVLQRGQIHVADAAVLEHLDAYSAPRLVEYFDGDPCAMQRFESAQSAAGAAPAPTSAARAKSLGVTIEAAYTVGEYDILILSASQSQGLETWLRESGYRVPAGAARVLGSYLKQGMKFFVAKVNLKEQAKTGFTYLRPIQVAYESPKFMLPIRLGMVNADGPQELFVFALTRKGRIETTNYRTVKLPADVDVPLFVKKSFGEFYKALFTEQVERHDMRAVFLEYAWDMNWCDPCAADPLSRDELRELGVFWLGEGPGGQAKRPNFVPPGGGAQDVFLTRLHLRYDGAHFPEDLVFQQTGDRQNFQGRYVLRHPWTGESSCEEARTYRRELPKRQEQEAQTLASLTGWDIADIRRRMNLKASSQVPPKDEEEPWWKKIWPDGR
ncbi:MAG TPA: DUF2330 domain-containing protein [Thermoanaerobaculia bacterium]|nr:DUF2330 domain-containing protein [Thermoanaerobaculia bacterium]